MTQLCGHERDDVAQVLMWTQTPKQHDLESMQSALRFMFGAAESMSMCAAAKDCYDVAKLAEMGVAELRRCGVVEYEHDPARVADVCDNDTKRICQRVRLFLGANDSYYSFAIRLFQKKLMLLLDVADGDSARAESILRTST